MPKPSQLREIDPVDAQTFHDEIASGYAPVVIRGLVRDWPLVQAAAISPRSASDYLLQFDQDTSTTIFVGPPETRGRFFYGPDMRGFNFERHPAKFGDTLRHLAAAGDRIDLPHIYAGAVEASHALPGFAEANPLPLVQGLGAMRRVWIGNRSIISAHFDSSDNIACVAAGRRRFTLFPPDQASNLYIGPLDNTMAGQPTSLVDFADPDFERFPRFRDALAAAQTAELEPGDAIYIPALWWHHVEALAAFNMLVNFWWSDSPDQDARFEAMVYAILAISHLPPERREGWSALFDHYVFKRHGEPAAHIATAHRGPLGEPTPRLRQYVKTFLSHGLQRP